MQKTPNNLRCHIGIFGRRNVGKSSILNALTGQNVSIVSDIAGTTTDPVEKPMELLPLGPVLFIDTAGIDDQGALGELRIERTRKVFDRVNLAIVVTDAGAWSEFERALVHELRTRNVPSIAVFNKSDMGSPGAEVLDELHDIGVHVEHTCAIQGKGIASLRQAIIRAAPEEFVSARQLWPISCLRRVCRARGADRQGGAKGKAHSSAGADDPRSA